MRTLSPLRPVAAVAAVVTALLASAVALAGATPAAAADAGPVARAAAALRAGPGVYVDPAATGKPLSSSDVDALRAAVTSASTPVFVAVLPDASRAAAGTHLRQLVDDVKQQGTYIVVGTGGFVTVSDIDGVDATSLAQEALSGHPHDPAGALTDYVASVDAAASAPADAPGSGTIGGGDSGDNGGGGGHSWVPAAILAAVVVGGVGLFAAGRRRRAAADAAALDAVRATATEDVTSFGADVAALDLGTTSPAEAWEDQRAALDAYERAKHALAVARRPEALAAVSVALEDGRWRLACVRARLAGQPLPERRPPCFFNPGHGPSVTDVAWAPPGGADRTVPACAADADRLARGVEPDERQVLVGARRMPYWQAPPIFGGWAGGWYGGWGGGGFLSGLVVGELLSGGMGWGGGWGGYDTGYADAMASGAAYDGGADPSDFASTFGGGGGWDPGGGGWDGSPGDVGGGGFDPGGGGWDGGGFDGGGGGGFDGGGGGGWN